MPQKELHHFGLKLKLEVKVGEKVQKEPHKYTFVEFEDYVIGGSRRGGKNQFLVEYGGVPPAGVLPQSFQAQLEAATKIGRMAGLKDKDMEIALSAMLTSECLFYFV